MVILLVHLLCLIGMSIWSRRNGSFSPGRLVLAALVPVFGLFCVVSLEYLQKNNKRRVEDLRINEPVLDDAIYRSIHIRPETDAPGILPVEESLLINAPAKRRKLLLNLLNQDISDYVACLRKAGVNDDTEVVHYAVTALVELRKEYNKKTFQMEEAFQKSSGDEIVEKYLALDEAYLRTGLAESRELEDRLRHYDDMLDLLLSDHTADIDKAVIFRKKAGCAMALHDYESAGQLLDRLIIQEPENEENYLMKIYCLSAVKNRQGIDEVIDMVRTNQVFLTESGRRILDFWQPDPV